MSMNRRFKNNIYFRKHASAPVVDPYHVIHEESNMDRILETPMSIPNNFSYDFYLRINCTMHHLLRTYAFLNNHMPKMPNEPRLKLPVLLPVWYNFRETNPFQLCAKQVNILLEFVYIVVKEFYPRPQQMLISSATPSGSPPDPFASQAIMPANYPASTHPSPTQDPDASQQSAPFQSPAASHGQNIVDPVSTQGLATGQGSLQQSTLQQGANMPLGQGAIPKHRQQHGASTAAAAPPSTARAITGQGSTSTGIQQASSNLPDVNRGKAAAKMGM